MATKGRAKVRSVEIEAERQLHGHDYIYGKPLPLLNGYVIAFHSADCARCSNLAAQAIQARRCQAEETMKAKVRETAKGIILTNEGRAILVSFDAPLKKFHLGDRVRVTVELLRRDAATKKGSK